MTGDWVADVVLSFVVLPGFKGFDALHLACAEAVGADVLLTVDERFLRRAQAQATDLRIRVISPITFIQEVV